MAVWFWHGERNTISTDFEKGRFGRLTENQIKEFLHELGADTDSKIAQDFIREQSEQQDDDFDYVGIARQTGRTVEQVIKTKERLKSEGKLNKPFSESSGSDETDGIFIKENNDTFDSVSEHTFQESKKIITGINKDVESSVDKSLYESSFEECGIPKNEKKNADEESNEDSFNKAIGIGGKQNG
jgi:hypothetical protein